MPKSFSAWLWVIDSRNAQVCFFILASSLGCSGLIGVCVWLVFALLLFLLLAFLVTIVYFMCTLLHHFSRFISLSFLFTQ